MPLYDDNNSSVTMLPVTDNNEHISTSSTAIHVGAIPAFNHDIATSAPVAYTTDTGQQQQTAVVPTNPQSDISREWKAKFEQLKKFKEKHNHLNIGKNTKLGRWVSSQHLAYRKYKMGDQQQDQNGNEINTEKIQQLIETGLDFDKKRGRKSVCDTDDTWDKMYAEMKDFNETNKHCVPPVR